MSSSRLWVRISNCSRLFLSTCGERSTVNFSMRVGSGMGPRTLAPVRFAVVTISPVDWSRTRWSKAFRRMRIFWLSMVCLSCVPAALALSLLDDGGDDAGAHGAATLADGKAQTLVHRNRRDQLDLHRHIVARHHHLGAARQLHNSRHIRRPEVELRTIVREERRVPTALLLRQDVGLRLELRVRRDRARLRQHLAALDLLALRAA